MLAFHTGAGWARGGFLGVSAFFTLSGFLICRLLLDEHARTGTIDLRAFWARRARRLLPAAMVALLGVLAYGALVGEPGDLASLRTDVVAALAYVANWRFVVSSQSYADLFRAPSAAQHFWSLAIEEQFYVVFPVLVLGAAIVGRRVGGRVRLSVGVLLGGLFLLSVAAGLLAGPTAGGDASRAYYGTDVRAAELLVGAGLAVAGIRRRRGVGVLAPFALAAVLWSWHAVDRADGRLYAGGFLLHAASVAALIVAAHGTTWLARALSLAPLGWLGRVSYGAYLYHWPIYLWLSPSRVGVDGWALSGLRLSITLSLAAASARWLEEPIRTGRRLRPRPARLALVGGAAAVLAVALLAVPASPPPATEHPVAASPASAILPVSTVPLRVYVVGDSVALRLGLRLQTWGAADGRMRVWVSGWLACAAARGGTYRYAGVAKEMEDRCNRWATIRAAELDEIRPDVVVASYGVFDVLDRRLPGSTSWQHLGQPRYDDYVRDELTAMQALLSSRGAHVVWLTSPYVETGGDESGFRPPSPFPEWDHARMDRFNELVRGVAATSPPAEVIDLRLHLRETWGDEQDPTRRPDGVHPSIPASDEIVAWLGPQLLDDQTNGDDEAASERARNQSSTAAGASGRARK